MKHATKNAFICSVVASDTTVDIGLLYENDQFIKELKSVEALSLDESIKHMTDWINSNY